MPYNGDIAAEAPLQANGPARGEKKTDEDKDCYRSAENNDNDQHGEKDCDQKNSGWYDIPCCDRCEHKEYEVYTPVYVKPYVHLYKPEAKCEGEMRRIPGCRRCNEECGEYEYTLAQKLSVNVPVKYGVYVHYYKPCVEEA